MSLFNISLPVEERTLLAKKIGSLFEIENNHGAGSFQQASLDVTNEVLAVWEYAGYGDILHNKTYILKNVKALQIGYKSLIQVPVNRRGGDLPSKRS